MHGFNLMMEFIYLLRDTDSSTSMNSKHNPDLQGHNQIQEVKMIITRARGGDTRFLLQVWITIFMQRAVLGAGRRMAARRSIHYFVVGCQIRPLH